MPKCNSQVGDIKLVPNLPETALKYAAGHGKYQMWYELLLEHGADVEPAANSALSLALDAIYCYGDHARNGDTNWVAEYRARFVTLQQHADTLAYASRAEDVSDVAALLRHIVDVIDRAAAADFGYAIRQLDDDFDRVLDIVLLWLWGLTLDFPDGYNGDMQSFRAMPIAVEDDVTVKLLVVGTYLSRWVYTEEFIAALNALQIRKEKNTEDD